MQDNIEFKKTEQFAVEEAEREMEWQLQYGSKMDEVIQLMDHLLQTGTELHDMFLDKSFFEHYKQTDNVAVMYVVMEIYERECKEQYTHTILEHGTTVRQLMDYLQRLKFILYRIDFSIDEESEKKLIQFIRKHQTSVITLETMMTTVVMRPMKLSLKLEELFEKNGMYRELFWIRNFINERWSGNHRILLRLAELYEKTGHVVYAKECMEQIPELLLLLYQQNKNYLRVQECVWKFCYKEMEEPKTLCELLLAENISEEIWELLLKNTHAGTEEYYLILSNEFLEHKMVAHAIKTLQIAKQMIPDNKMIDRILSQCQRLVR